MTTTTQSPGKDDEATQRWFLVGHMVLVAASILVGAIVWISHGSLWNTRICTVEYSGRDKNYQPVPTGHYHAWMENVHVWIALVIAFFISGMILLQSFIRNRICRLLLCFALLMLTVLVIWFRIVWWEDWWGVSPHSKIIGTPLAFLFVPLAFFMADWLQDKETHSVVFLTGRAFFELALTPAWIFVWGWIMLFLGWIWI